MEVDETLVNGHASTSCIKEEKMEDGEWDPDEGMSDFYRHHPCARNEPYPSTSRGSPVKEEDSSDTVDYVELSLSKSPKTPFVPPSKRDDAPLASILNPQLDNIDPRRFFADYELDSVVRFSRIFASNIKSSSKAEIWWPSKTFHKKVSAEKPPKSERKGLTLTFAPDPPVEALAPDEEALMLSSKSNVKSSQASTSNAGDGPAEETMAPWRAGPAKIWFDRAGVPSTASTYDYGLVKRKKVLDELKYGVEPACGWVPTQYTRTYEQYMLAGELAIS
nr:Transcription initiation factor TFIID subunit 1 [Haemonchus contortus]